MQDKTQEITKLVFILESLLIQIKDQLAATPVSATVNSSFQMLQDDLPKFAGAIETNNLEGIKKSAKNIASSCQAIGHLAPKMDSKLEELKDELIAAAESVREIVAEPPQPLKPLDPVVLSGFFTGAAGLPNLTSQPSISWSEQDRHDQRFKKALSENDLRISGLEQKLSTLESNANSEIAKITAAYSDALREIEGKKTEIDSILGHVSGRAVAGDYEKSATEEKSKADWLRIGSLLCMAMIAVSLGYSFWETIGTEFNWQKSLFRITLTFLLSVPAAYLARESAKHREQQYQHLQTSLDLKAISPFLASLPDEEQHKIKIAIASKLFAGRDFSKTSADPFPLNTQEIIMELLKRLDLSKIQASKES